MMEQKEVEVADVDEKAVHNVCASDASMSGDVSPKGTKGGAKSRRREFFRSLVLFVGIFISSFYVIPTFAAERTVVDGHSMENNLYDGEQLLADKIAYKFLGIDRFDVITFYPEGRVTDDTPVGFVERRFLGKKDKCYIKRVIGLPGETVQIVGADILINGKKLEEDYGKMPMASGGIAEEPVTLGEDEYFVLGDNRNGSRDSRDIGPVKEDMICGKIVFHFN